MLCCARWACLRINAPSAGSPVALKGPLDHHLSSQIIKSHPFQVRPLLEVTFKCNVKALRAKEKKYFNGL